MSDAIDVDDFLAHHGVLGMKWGRHTARSDSGGSGGSAKPGKSRSELRALNKASAAKDAEKHAKSVDAARERINSGANAQKYKDAKAQYKADKAVIGKREALKAFNKVKDENIADFEKAGEYRDGKEATKAMLIGVAGAVALTAVKAALKS